MAAFTNHQQILADAWNQPANTTLETRPQDVNKILHAWYEADPLVSLTRGNVWEMETRKAADPAKYIPNVVKAGSVEKFPSTYDGQYEYFTRISDQKVWNHPTTYTTVIEHVCVDHNNQIITFIGADEFTAPDGRTIVRGVDQPLFHVEHGVGGEDDQPLNTWKIVHLTREVDPTLTAGLKAWSEKGNSLTKYLEVYIQEDLNVQLRHKQL